MAFGSSSIVIEELSGKRRRLELTGAGLPFKGATWGSRLIAVTSINPGNGDDATQHVLAAAEMPGSWQGEWNTTRLVSSPAQYRDGVGQKAQPISRASSLLDVFRTLQRGGQRLRVTWAQGTALADRKISREGLCIEFVPSIATADDIAWEMTWEWAGTGRKYQRAASLRNDKLASSLKSANLQLSELAGEILSQEMLTSAADALKNPAALPFTIGDLEAIAQLPQDYMRQLGQMVNLVNNRVEAFASLMKTAATTPVIVANQAVDIAANATANFAQIVDDMGQSMPDAYTELEGDAAGLVSAASFFSVAQDGAERVLGTFAQIQLDLRRQYSATDAGASVNDQLSSSGILNVHISKEGETFLTIAWLYYKNADLAEMITKANNFAAYEVSPPAGSVLVIPALSPILLGQ